MAIKDSGFANDTMSYSPGSFHSPGSLNSRKYSIIPGTEAFPSPGNIRLRGTAWRERLPKFGCRLQALHQKAYSARWR